MASPSQPTGGPAAEGCAEQRAAVDRACAEARGAKEAHAQVVEHGRELRRELTSAQHAADEARRAADEGIRAAEKAAARDAYQLARATAASEEDLRTATAAYARALDRSNRAGLRAGRSLHQAKVTVEGIESAIAETERRQRALRLEADQAEAACLDARVRLAACEEAASAPAKVDHATRSEPHAATGGHAVAISESGSGPPLVIESLVSGDRVALELAAARISDHTGRSPAESQLQLQELVEAIISAASHDGFLVFDPGHRFWSTLSFEESRDVIAALDRLGFILEPSEGWHAGRAPAPADLSMALAYAGLDPRNMHDLPTADELATLPGTIGVDARAFLARRAPQLTVDTMVSILDRRAAELEPLWNEWGSIRPILLADRHALGSLPG